MPFVLDASTAISWYFPGEQHSDATVALGRMRTDTAFVPLHWWFEIRNSMLIGERRRRFSDKDTSHFLDQLTRMRVVEALRPSDTFIFILARKHNLTFYDAAYLELALREGVALATLDAELAAAARVEGVPLVAVG
jgi:predicted nucleic acid-binding protein